MNIATLPPEINSERMYGGPGPGSMTEAVTAWERLATRLYAAAADYRAVTSKLAARSEGAAAAAITQSAAPYINWLTTTATQAEHAATQAMAAARAYDSALAAMVPPPVIEANRAYRTELAKTNCLGQTSPAIAETDAVYERMWAQDTEAMYSYAGDSADASTVTPFAAPPTTAGPPGRGAALPQLTGTWKVIAAPQVISAGRQVISTIPEALQSLSLSPLTTFDASLSPVSSSLSKLSSLSAPSDFAIDRLNSLNKSAALNQAAALRSLLTRPGVARGAPFTAGLGRATSIGALSVPQAWAAATTPSPVAWESSYQSWGSPQVRLVDIEES
jgi:PPE-repeat protein